MMKRLRITVCALLVLMLIAGCAGSPSFMDTKQASSANDYAWEEEAPMMAASEAEAPKTDSDYQAAAGGYDAGASDPNYGNHKIITTYTFEMRTDEFDNHFKQLQDKAAQLNKSSLILQQMQD